MKYGLALLVAIVAVLHHDFWNWTNKSLVLGFVPIGLAYHVGYAFLACFTMWMLVKFAWPTHLEELETKDEG